ncbi:ABC transporter substrate-binding protein [Roseospira marina]|uniref:ABC transporter substrate-binding protein n=1 Tax=Roseospira marina TaxID=140057 RepID=A0A5M6IDY7_9PROT|nr:ABC transporter substrate-binding protein [Roseospira marina]KAA5606501.1 ABC transporter substrate-binding protein [Roseospira marina]MBB4314076.1 peptide/nickel transport system substrate-binding protein [Roseospira marina]MBB5087237.1 peptide/nickel transport system substrate-binding protein [Roseospira marina]
MTFTLKSAATGALMACAVAVGADVAGVAPADAKTLRMAYDADPVSLDPQEQLSGGTLEMAHMVFDPLVRFTQDMAFEPRLAESWERIDDTTMRFHLREGVTFHSGNPFTAEDVVFTFNRMKKSPDFKGLFEPFEAAKAIDDYTVDLITTEPYPLVLNMATYIFPMDKEFYTGTDENGKPKDIIIKHGDAFATSHESGTGPFVVTAREQGVRVEFTRFADYWDTESPGNVTEIIFTPIKEDPTRVASLLSGGVDYIKPVPPNDLERLGNDPNVNLVTMGGTRIITLQMNQKRVEAFKDPRVRQAIVYAINNAGIVDKIMKGFGTVAGQQSAPGMVGYNPDLTPRYDLAKAKALMKEAGYEDGFSVTMMTPNNRYVNDAKIAEAVAAMLARINIKVDLTTLPKAQYWPEFDVRAADIMMIGWHADTEDSANYTEFLTMTPNADTGFGQYNAGNYSNPKVDEMILQSQTMVDLEARAALLQDVERILYDDAAFVPLHWQNLSWAARKGVHIEDIVNVMDFPYLGDLVIDD